MANSNLIPNHPISFQDLMSGKDQVPESASSASSKNSIFSAETEYDSQDKDTSKRLKTASTSEASSPSLSINPAYTTTVFKNAVRSLLKAWKEGSTASSADVQPALSFVFRKPFPHLVFPDFFRGPIEAVEEELLSQEFNLLSTDLMQLSQTKELSLEKVTEFAGVTRTFRHEVRPWVEAITNIELLPVVDIRGAKYGFTDHLVCHDDRLASRKVAYVYYLTDPSWSAEDGGSLDLFDCSCLNDNIIPGTIEKSIMPVRNSMVLFVVGDDSFHQVSEVLSTRKTRLSLTGWFHSKTASPSRTEYQEHPEIQHREIFQANKEDMDISFLARENDQLMIARKQVLARDLKKYQACTVRNLVANPFYQNVVKELRSKDQSLPWSVPANRNQAGCYKYLDINSHKWSKDMPNFDHLLRTFLTERFLHSLTEITALSLTTISEHQLSKTMPPQPRKKDSVANGSGSSLSADLDDSLSDRWLVELAQFRLERFEARNYTLKTSEAVQMDEVIDVFYFMDCDLLETDCGGTVCLVDINEPTEDWEPIVQMDGESNGLMIARREKDVVFFTEYLNHRWARRNAGRPFYRLWMSFPAGEMAENSPGLGSESYSTGSEEDESEDSDLVEPDVAHAALSTSEEDEED